MGDVAAALLEELENFGVDVPQEDVMQGLVDLCASLAIQPSDLADQWMAFSVNNSNLDLDLVGLKRFKLHTNKENAKPIKREMRSPMIKKERKALNASTSIGDMFDDVLSAYLPDSSPIRQMAKPQKRPLESPTNSHITCSKISKMQRPPTHLEYSLSPSNASLSQSYSQRKGSGDIVCKYNEGGHSEDVKWRGQGGVNVQHCDPTTALTVPYKFMFQKLSLKANSLDEHVELMGEKLAAQHGLTLESVADANQGEVTLVGRIVCDSMGKLNPSSVLLEGSIETSGGRSVAVDLKQLEKYSLFPGQIVAMKGTNPTGRLFVPTLIYNQIPAPVCKTERSEKTLTMFAACGPFTSQDSLSYESLADLTKIVQVECPDVVLLCGPFVDSKHPLVEKGDLGDMTAAQLLQNQIKHLSTSFPPTTQLVIIPSHRDIACDPVYPQPPPSIPALSSNVMLASDPCLLNVEGVSVGVTSTDVLFHLSAEEISHPPGSDRMGRLAGHLLNQHNFYPLHPPSEELNVDYPNFVKHGFFKQKPDILLLPSDLRYFAKNVQDTVVLNPGKLGKGAGTFVKLVVNPTSAKISDCVYANIVKI